MENLRWNMTRSKIFGVFVFILFTAAFAVAQTGPDDSGKSLGIVASKDASAKDVGLPMYPGAKLARKDGEGDPTAQIGLWAGGSGFKLVIVKLESSDPSDKIASYYRGALGKYGKVLDCSGVKARDGEKDSKSRELSCDDDNSDSGILLKSGTKDKQHIVGVEEKDGRRVIHLVYLISQSDDGKI